MTPPDGVGDHYELRIDAYAPAEIAGRVRDVGVTKANLDRASMFALAVLAGAFIGLGACFSTLSVSGNELGYGLQRIVAGITFSMGLILVIVAGAELFTGNNLVVMAWAEGRVSLRRMLSSWAWVYLGNFVGAVTTAGLIFFAAPWVGDGHTVGAAGLRIAAAKCQLAPLQAFFLGVMCNALVCLAVWLCFSARSTTDKILSILFPITAFVALGFEHSIANMYFIPMGLMLESEPAVRAAAGLDEAALTALSWTGFARNLVPVTLGNVVGGSLLVGGMYWFIYLRNSPDRMKGR
ncbi:MAG: formate/nitrite transporter family protein [Deltaproteobacteria bacterium]|nr:formate/nitrite transporter family protein [Deltaproteobacteria bacterium]